MYRAYDDNNIICVQLIKEKKDLKNIYIYTVDAGQWSIGYNNMVSPTWQG